MDNGLNPRDNDKVEAGDETAEAHVNNNEWGTNVSSDGLISNRQFIAGCTALVNRCHERPWVNVSKYEFVEKELPPNVRGLEDYSLHRPTHVADRGEGDLSLEVDDALDEVPVLYLHTNHLPPNARKDIDTLYQWVVPHDVEQDIRSSGIIGGISMGVSDHPAYFIHPCNTAEALQQVVKDRHISPLEYLQIWLGLVGPCVGLYLSKDLVVNSLVRQ